MAFVTRAVLANCHMSNRRPHCLQLFLNVIFFFRRVINWLYCIPKLWYVIEFIILINGSGLKLPSSHKSLLMCVMTGFCAAWC